MSSERTHEEKPVERILGGRGGKIFPQTFFLELLKEDVRSVCDVAKGKIS